MEVLAGFKALLEGVRLESPYDKSYTSANGLWLGRLFVAFITESSAEIITLHWPDNEPITLGLTH